MNFIYCDESCYLKKDKSNIMVLGGILCLDRKKNILNKKIEILKEKYNLNKNSEIKWTKVSEKFLPLYKEILKLIINKDKIKIGVLIIHNKKYLNHTLYNQTHDEWYNKMYYFLLNSSIFINSLSLREKSLNKVFFDIKDTKGGKRLRTLQNFLINRDEKHNILREYIGIYQVNSKESNLLQVLDLIIGMISYYFNHEITDNPKSKLLLFFLKEIGMLDSNKEEIMKKRKIKYKRITLLNFNLKVGDIGE